MTVYKITTSREPVVLWDKDLVSELRALEIVAHALTESACAVTSTPLEGGYVVIDINCDGEEGKGTTQLFFKSEQQADLELAERFPDSAHLLHLKRQPLEQDDMMNMPEDRDESDDDDTQ